MKCFLLILIIPLFGQDKSIQVHGFLGQGYLKSEKHDYLVDSREGSFSFYEAGVNLSTQLTEKLRLGLQLFSRKLGDLDKEDVIIDWAYGDYRYRDWLGIRLGKIKMPLGIYNQTRDTSFLHPTIFLPQSSYSEGNRSLSLAYSGVNLYGIFADKLEYDVFVGGIQIDEELPIIVNLASFLSGGLPVHGLESKSQEIWGGSLLWLPLDGLKLGVSRVETNIDLNFLVFDQPQSYDLDPVTVDFLSVEYQYYPWTFASERSRITIEGPLGELVAVEGFYARASVKIYEKWDLSYTFDRFYPNRHARDQSLSAPRGLPPFIEWQKDHSISVRYLFHEQWSIKGEYHKVDGLGLIFGYDLGGFGPGLEQDWGFFAFKTSFHF